jgi:gas vesicle protein
MATLLSRKTDADRAGDTIQDAIARMASSDQSTDLRSRIEAAMSAFGDPRSRMADAGGRVAYAGGRVADAGSRWIETGAERAKAAAKDVPPKVAREAADRARHLASSVPIRVQVGRQRKPSVLPWVLLGVGAAVVGAVMAFLFDPEMGRSRRAVAGDRVAGGARKVSRWTDRQRRGAAASATALREQIRSANAPARTVDEVGLTARVRTELFRDASIDKGAINVNAEGDVIFLRGTAPTDEQAAEIGRRAEAIEGVGSVVNLLHVPGAGMPVMTEDETEADRPRWAIPH